jgi:predicted transcriptional regulator
MQEGRTLHWISGLNPWCFFSHDINYKVSTATLFRLVDLKLVKKDQWGKAYILTELGKNFKEL